MENFFKWIMVPVPKEEIVVWFNVNNIHYEKIELFGDIFKSLNEIITSTYLGGGNSETTIYLTNDDNIRHFEWCWSKIIKDFKLENTHINLDGEHKDYFFDFYIQAFYESKDKSPEFNIDKFLSSIFNISDSYTKSDLDILTQIYKIMDKNVY